MQSEYERYAIYFAPRADTELARFGRKWLGVDAEKGTVSEPPSIYVNSPRRYGFHATLKAPMRLAPERNYGELRDTVKALSAELKIVELGRLKLKAIGSFLALMIDDDFHTGVSNLAWACVTKLDGFRAELTDTELNKRTQLSPEEKANLERWGYPYVGNRFRFHMTLTSSLNERELAQARTLLQQKIPTEAVLLDSICIFGDPGALKPFELVERMDLKG